MEQTGITHRVKAFISHDVPHLGVNVPLGYQYLAQHLYDVYDDAEWLFFEQDILHWLRYVSLLTLTQFQTYKNEVLAIREAPSVRQMLSVYVNKYKQLDYSQFNGLMSTLSQMGFPQGDPGCEIINLCISNGGVNDYVTSSTNRLLDIDVYADSGGLLTALIPVWGLWDYEHFGVLGLIPTMSSFRTVIRISPNRGDGNEIAYATSQYQKQTGLFSGVTRQNQNLTFSYYSPLGDSPKDTDFGSYYDMYRDTTNVQMNWNFAAHWKANFAMERKFMFVPSVSSLCYKNGLSLSNSDYTRNFMQDAPSMSDIPFDGYLLWNASSYHTSYTNTGLLWADRMLDLDFAYIPSQVDSLDGFQFQISDIDPSKGYYSVDWSTSDSSIASISSNGTLTFVNWGTVSVYADIVCYGGHRRLTHTITIPPVQFPGFPSYYLSYIDPPTDLNGNVTGGYQVSAHRTTSIDSRFLSHFTYHWGVKYNNGDSIQWSTSTSTGYYCNMPDLANARMVYFKVQYENQFSQTYSIYLRYPLVIGLVDGSGNVYSGDSGGWVGQVKGEISEGRFVFSCLGFEELFEQYPAPDETIRRMLLHQEFIEQLKVLKPWGKEELVLIPYMYRREDKEKWEEKVMTFIYKEIIQ